VMELLKVVAMPDMAKVVMPVDMAKVAMPVDMARAAMTPVDMVRELLMLVKEDMAKVKMMVDMETLHRPVMVMEPLKMMAKAMDKDSPMMPHKVVTPPIREVQTTNQQVDMNKPMTELLNKVMVDHLAPKEDMVEVLPKDMINHKPELNLTTLPTTINNLPNKLLMELQDKTLMELQDKDKVLLMELQILEIATEVLQLKKEMATDPHHPTLEVVTEVLQVVTEMLVVDTEVLLLLVVKEEVTIMATMVLLIPNIPRLHSVDIKNYQTS